MPNVVVMGGKIKCSHGGEASLPRSSSKLTVKGVGVVVSGMEMGISFAATPVPCRHQVGGSPSPCTATNPATSGISKKIRVNSLGVLLDTGRGQALNSPMATWDLSEAGQNILVEG